MTGTGPIPPKPAIPGPAIPGPAIPGPAIPGPAIPGAPPPGQPVPDVAVSDRAVSDRAVSDRAGSGRIEGRGAGAVHLFPVRVYYEDTDAGGVVYHANVLRYAERARTELLRLLGVDRSGGPAGIVWMVRRSEIDWLRPARLDESLTIRTDLSRLGGAHADLCQDLLRGPDLLASLKLRLVCVNQSGRPVRLPGEVRTALRPFQRPGDDFPTDLRA